MSWNFLSQPRLLVLILFLKYTKEAWPSPKHPPSSTPSLVAELKMGHPGDRSGPRPFCPPCTIPGQAAGGLPLSPYNPELPMWVHSFIHSLIHLIHSFNKSFLGLRSKSTSGPGKYSLVEEGGLKPWESGGKAGRAGRLRPAGTRDGRGPRRH